MRLIATTLWCAVAAAQVARPHDYARLTPVGLDPVAAYVVEQPPVAIAPAGTVEACPPRIGLLPTTSEDPHAFISVVGRHAASGARQELGVGLRACAVTSWRTIDGDYNVSWMSTGSSTGGNGLGPNERRFAHYGLPNQQHYNPTMGGSKRVPYREGPYFAGWPMHVLSTATSTEGGAAPLEWDYDGTENGTDLGGDLTHPVLAWRERQFQRVEWHLGGRRHVHRVTYWGYQPDGWLAGTGLDPVLAYVACTPHLRGRLFDDAYFLDLKSGVLTNLDDAATEADEWNPPPGVRKRCRWDAWLGGLLITDDEGRNETRPSPVPSGYAAALYRRSSDDFCVAFAVRIYGDSQQCRRPTGLTMIQAVELHVPTTPDGAVEEQLDECSICELSAKSHGQGRARGWVGMSYLVGTGSFAQVRAALVQAYAQGLLDQPPPRGLPVLGGVTPP